jgi:tetratricopeptide (TPR) repeat protein
MAVVCSVELGLRLAGFGCPASFCLRDRALGKWTENPRFLQQFFSRASSLRPNPIAVGLEKPTNSVRILLVGESAAAGTPEPAYGFGRMLERMLHRGFPDMRIEVINIAMRGVNSHILLPAVRDACRALRPEFVLVYMGNNEAVGLYAPGPGTSRFAADLRVIRMAQTIRRTRIGQAVSPWFGASRYQGAPGEGQDDAFFLAHRVASDDARRARVCGNFRANLIDICSAARDGGAEVFLLTLAVNLRECAPLGSLHRPDLSPDDQARWEQCLRLGVEAEAAGRLAEATDSYKQALALDSSPADLHFRLGSCYSALGKQEDAAAEFRLARARDALPFRADARLNGIIRDVAHLTGAHLLDVEAAFEKSDLAPGGVPGDRLFYDHVHFNFDGDYLVARTVWPALRDAVRAKKTPGFATSPDPLAREETARQLAFTRVNEGRALADMVKATALPPFTLQADHVRRQKAREQDLLQRFGNVRWKDLDEASEAHLAVMKEFPDDWHLPFNLARLRMVRGDYQGAVENFRRAEKLLPHWSPIRVSLSAALAAEGRTAEALEILNRELSRSPGALEIRAAIERLSGGATTGRP